MTGPLFLALAFVAAAPSEAPAPLGLGEQLADFSLLDIHRRTCTLSDFAGQKAYVIVFAGTECPLANLYVPTLVKMHEEYAPRGVQYFMVNSNVQDSFNRVSGHAQEREIPFPVLKDFDQTLAKRMGAQRTPEVFLLDASRRMIYRGLIDDQYGLTYKRAQPRVEPLRDALEAYLAGEPIRTPETEAVGCVIPKLSSPRVSEPVTYNGEVSRIIQQRCQECHRKGQIGPFALMTYNDAKAWSETIYEAVLEERMPPWHADPNYGLFANERKLRQREIDLLLSWVDQGCPRGDDEDLPEPREFTEGWTIGKPDLVIEMPSEFDVPGTGVVPYKRFVVDPGFQEDVWVSAAEARPGNRAVVHHVLVYIQAPGKRLFERDGTASTLVGWAPGDMPAIFDDGVALRVPAGSKFVFEMHYTPNGTPQTDRSSFGIIFTQKPPSHEAVVNILAQWIIQIPPGVTRHSGKASYTFTRDARILSFMPHMHYRGLSARYVLTRVDGSSETLLSVPDYDFNWQSVYRFQDPISVHKGDRIDFIGYWDNSAANPRNPDATRTVAWGEQTWDEMLNGWLGMMLEREVVGGGPRE